MTKVTFFSMVLATLLFTGCSDTASDSGASDGGGSTSTGDKNSTDGSTPPGNDGLVSSSGIYLAESNETRSSIYKFYTHPLYLGSKLYTRQYKEYEYGSDRAMKFVVYDMSSFHTDMNMSDLSTEVIYEQVGPNFTSDRTNHEFYDIAEIDNKLYFTTLPKDESTKTQSSFLRYDITTGTKETFTEVPVYGENLNKTFDLVKGRFVPFDSNQYIGVIRKVSTTVLNADGTPYMEGSYAYYGRGPGTGTTGIDTVSPVVTDEHFLHLSGETLYKTSFFSTKTDYGERAFDDPGLQEYDLLQKFKSSYTGDNNYTSMSSFNTSLVLDGDDLYTLVFMRHEDSEGYDIEDLYLLHLDSRDLSLQSSKLLVSNSGSTSMAVTQFYKYKDVLYFKYRPVEFKEQLWAYDLTSESFKFKHNIGGHPYFSENPYVPYAITGTTVIVPEIVKPEDNDDNNYDLVFNVLDIADGSVLKTIRHKDLMDLNDNNDVRILDSYSDSKAVLFTGLRKNKEGSVRFEHNLIIKIDSNNSVEMSRFRFDAHLTGVITDK